MSVHREIDTHFQGAAHAVCAHWIDGYLVDPGPESSVRNVLEALGGEAPRAVLLTHIHLDHAGAAGALVREWPDVEVWVHRNGARHIIDPSRLVASATRIYGERMGELWGEIVPVPESNVRILDETAPTDLAAGFRWAWTPGHAVHHVSFLHEDSGIAFCGDVAGVRIGAGPVVPPTPPPDIDVPAWHRSLELVAAWDPSALAVTHYGTFTDVDRQLTLLHDELDRLAAVAREGDAERFERHIRDALAGKDDEAAYLKAMPPETLYAGLARYWRNVDTGERT